mgnify:CR=1 FL=1
MRQIIGAFGILFIMMANIFICTGLIGASGQVAAAKSINHRWLRNWKTVILIRV